MLGLSTQEFGLHYGRHFIQAVSEDGYEELLKGSAATLPEFLAHMNALHVHLGSGLARGAIQAPDFQVEQVRCAALCCAALCCAVLCCAALRCAVPCCAALWVARKCCTCDPSQLAAGALAACLPAAATDGFSRYLDQVSYAPAG
jgi:hypothetical protein